MLGRKCRYDSSRLQEHGRLCAFRKSRQHGWLCPAIGSRQHGGLCVIRRWPHELNILKGCGSGQSASGWNPRLLISRPEIGLYQCAQWAFDGALGCGDSERCKARCPPSREYSRSSYPFSILFERSVTRDKFLNHRLELAKHEWARKLLSGAETNIPDLSHLRSLLPVHLDQTSYAASLSPFSMSVRSLVLLAGRTMSPFWLRGLERSSASRRKAAG